MMLLIFFFFSFAVPRHVYARHRALRQAPLHFDDYAVGFHAAMPLTRRLPMIFADITLFATFIAML